MQTEKAKIPIRPIVLRTMLLAQKRSAVRLMEASAKGAPCDTVCLSVGQAFPSSKDTLR